MAKRLNFFLMFLLCFIFLVNVNFISGAPPVTKVQQFTEGYEMKYPLIDTLKQSQDYEFYFHVFNISSGLPVSTGIACNFHLYDYTGKHIWNQTLIKATTFNVSNEWGAEIKGTNFSNIGLYSYITQCNSTSYGGFNSVAFEVTPTGISFDTAKSIFYIALLSLLIFFFLLDIFGIARLPTGNARADSGNIISINLIKYLKPALVVIAWGLIVSILFISSSISKNYLLDSGMSSFLFGFYKLSVLFVYPMLILGFAWMILMIFNDIKIKQLLDRGLSTQ